MTEKRGRGRPPERVETIWVRVTPEVKQALTEDATRAGMSLSAYVARLIETAKSPR